MLSFRSLRSGSSGNLLLLESRGARRTSRVLIDCGIRSQRECARILEEEAGPGGGFDGLVVTHAHFDHVNYSTLRVLSRLGVPVYAHRKTAREIGLRCLNPYRVPASFDPSEITMHRFSSETFEVGAFRFQPLPVPHAPGITTHAFLIHAGRRRLLVASDFNDPEAVIPHIYNCDFIYLESNHDLELLRRYFNPASLFHLSNPAAGLLLRHALQKSRRRPQAIMLAHLSEERNDPAIALATVRDLAGADAIDGIPMTAAPRHAASARVEIGE